MSTINIRKALLEMDKNTNLQYNLTPLYESMRLSEDKKNELVKYLDNYDIDATNKLLSNEFQAQGLAESVDDDLSDEELDETDFDVELTESVPTTDHGVYHYPSCDLPNNGIIFIGSELECGLFIEDNNLQDEAEVCKLDTSNPKKVKRLDEGAWDIIKDGVKNSNIVKGIKDVAGAAKEETTWQGFKDNLQQRNDERAAERGRQAAAYKEKRLAQAQQAQKTKQDELAGKYVDNHVASNGSEIKASPYGMKNGQQNNQQTNTQGTNQQTNNPQQAGTQQQRTGKQNTIGPKGEPIVKGQTAKDVYYQGKKLTPKEWDKLPSDKKRDAVAVGPDGKYIQRGRDQKWVGKPAKVTKKSLWVAENLNEDFDADNTFIEDGVEYSWLDKDITSHMSVGPDGFTEEWFLASAVSEDDGETYYFIVDENDFIDWGPCDTEEEAREFLYSKDDDYDEDDLDECSKRQLAKEKRLNERYTDYDPEHGWTEDDIKLHKSIDWAGRNYEEYPVPEDSFNGKAYAYGLNPDRDEVDVKFIKFIRPNPIFPPYYAPEKKPFDGVVGSMYDGRKHGTYDIHDRYETQDVYDMLSEDVDEYKSIDEEYVEASPNDKDCFAFITTINKRTRETKRQRIEGSYGKLRGIIASKQRNETLYDFEGPFKNESKSINEARGESLLDKVNRALRDSE